MKVTHSMKYMKSHLGLSLLMFGLVSIIAAQDVSYTPSDHRGNPIYRRKTEIDGNLVRASIFNYGFSGRTGGGQPTHVPYEWPKNTKQHYIALTGVFYGAEVFSDDSIPRKIKVMMTPNYRTEPQTGDSWNLEPVPEFLNQESDLIAKSTVPGSWPTEWPDRLDDVNDPGWAGSWNGYFGKDQFNADQEIYYECTDNWYDRHLYFPDTTDLTRRGLGILTKVRVLAWSQITINDVVFHLHTLTNDGTKDLTKTGFSLWLADLVGGDGDSDDDSPSFDLLNNVAWSVDGDGVGNTAFGSSPVGVVATAFLETPGNGVDGIDNDGDADYHPTLLMEYTNYDTLFPTFTSLDFDSLELEGGEKLVRIDENYARHIFMFPGTDTAIVSQGVTWNLSYGDVLKENPDNLIDDDLDGLIDETEDLHRDRWTLNGPEPVRYINYKYFDVGDTLRRGLIVPGGSTPYNQSTVAPMIDETRADGVDNDRDWTAFSDDVGLDGKKDTFDEGEGDGEATSGQGTGLPGEPNIDVTDVSESDQVGLTAAAYRPSSEGIGSLNDATFWRYFMTPGVFFDPTIQLEGDYNLHVTSGYFPLQVGQTESISMAINMGVDPADALRNKEVAQKTYDLDYNFATAPRPPNVSAAIGDGTVTLYWDETAEASFDRYMADLGSEGYDFQGYRIYRSTDPAFEDAYIITDADGVPTFYKPIAQFDKVDGIKGLQELDINGIKFDMGDDTGLQHKYIDDNVLNGRTYYYAVTSYDPGDVALGVAPSECPIYIQVTSDGTVVNGVNTVTVTPAPKPLGYEEPEYDLVHTQGSSSSSIYIDIVDPLDVPDNNTYRITFQDTLLPASSSLYQDTLTTKNFSWENITDINAPDTLILHSTKFQDGDENIVVDGLRISFHVEPIIELNKGLTGWNDSTIFDPALNPYNLEFSGVGLKKPNDYTLTFGPVGTDTSTSYDILGGFVNLPSQAVNFTVYNETEKKRQPFAFYNLVNGDTLAPFGGPSDGRMNSNTDESDVVIFIDEVLDTLGNLTGYNPTWQLTFKHLVSDSARRHPTDGDILELIIKKPFLADDIYEFKTAAAYLDEETAKDSIGKITVVPNPYVAATSWEPSNPYNTGRGPRVLRFNHIPKDCDIKIFTINGELVDQFEVHNFMDEGSTTWDMLTLDNLAISYGLYLFYVEDLNTGATQTGKFAVIK
ncbi:MAG: hypothetical protein K9M49_02635 [Candidatus Marinimicrobia bacterium]|nr:hypothetical protein [Candidatus Neomarinimicrobiota bacterium]MCF7851060.1 hypothetical protein [Candidatus Neomarinimicrobiota bacterium]MCF7904030.1 hypothetical protein [Candidatus Neomarinimicrobiota bacterium]